MTKRERTFLGGQAQNIPASTSGYRVVGCGNSSRAPTPLKLTVSTFRHLPRLLRPPWPGWVVFLSPSAA